MALAQDISAMCDTNALQGSGKSVCSGGSQLWSNEPILLDIAEKTERNLTMLSMDFIT